MSLRLSQLIGADREEHPVSLPNVFGDNYLNRNCALFRRTREATLALGYSYQPVESHDLLSLPTLALQEMIDNHEIPFLPNKSAYNIHFSKGFDGLNISVEYLFCGLNYLTHESCHCLFDNALERRFDRFGERQYLMLKYLGAEAFALTVELFLHLHSENSTMDFFLRRNTHFLTLSSWPDIKAKFVEISKVISVARCFKLTFFSFLLHNLGYTKAYSCHLKTISKNLQMSDEKPIRLYYDTLFAGISFNFIFNVHRIYAKALGSAMTMEDIVSIDDSGVIDAPEIYALLEEVSQIYFVTGDLNCG